MKDSSEILRLLPSLRKQLKSMKGCVKPSSEVEKAKIACSVIIISGVIVEDFKA